MASITSIQPGRFRVLKEGSRTSDQPMGPVVYWMFRDQRLRDNWALIHAVDQANKANVPVAVAFNLFDQFLGAKARQLGFMLKGLRQLHRSITATLQIPFFLFQGKAEDTIPNFLRECGASLLVTDFSPLREIRRCKEEIYKKVTDSVIIHEVDAHNIVPVWVASDKLEYSAKTLRGKINKLLPEYLIDFPMLQSPDREWTLKDKLIDWDGLIDDVLRQGAEVPEIEWCEPGEDAAMEVLMGSKDGFLTKRLKNYSAERNNPLKPKALSRLSPYLHFGQISAQRCALEARGVRKLCPQAVDTFLEELIVRRELADNFCFYEPRYDSLRGAWGWAQTTLMNHASDKRDGGLCKEGTSDPSDRHEKNRRELPRGAVGYFYGHGQKMSSDSSPIADFKSPMKEPALTRNLNTGVMTGDCKCNEALRSEVDALSSQFPHKNMVVSRPRPSIIDSIGDRIEGADSSLHHGLRDSRMAWDRYSYLHGQSLDVTGASCTLQQDESRIAHLCNRRKSYLTETLQFPEDYGVELPFETTSLQARKEVYVGNENMRWENDYGFKGDGHPVIFQDGLTSRSQSENEEGIYDIKHWSQQMLTDEELNMHDQSETKMRENRAIDLRLITQNRTPKVSQEWDGYNEALGCVEQQWIDHDIKQLSTPNSSELEYSPNCGVDFDLSFPSPRVSVKERLGIPIKPSSRDIMKRLGPRRKANLISPWLKYHITRDSSRGNFENLNGRLPAGRNDSLKSKVKRKEKEPPEDSEEFKQRIHSAFLKHYKSLNEIPSQRRKYMMQGNGVVKCCVCGRNFEGSLSVTTHAFNSHMVGMRADHLGLHRALCVLMGWKYEGAPNGTWVMRKLPDAELMSLKEDLLIWPPVVVFHNCSIANNCSERRRFMSIEELGAIVRGMGISGITKLSHGRPANQSVMVVSFQGTLSGLQEAERLEKFYAATEHGRADFQKLSGSGSAIGNKAREPITDTISDVLYGYLGIAEDLEKLDFEIRRRSVLKSKNEIRAIVNATLSAN